MKFKNVIKKIGNFFKDKDNVLTIAIVLGILVVVNFLSYQIFFRADLTQNDIYSISDVSKGTVKNLDDIVKIEIYFSENIPNKYVNLKQNVKDILNEYANYSDGNVAVEDINPGEMEDAKSELRQLGIPSVQFNVMENDSYQVTNGYMGINVQYGDENEAIPVVKNTDDLEYKITTAVKKVTQEGMPSIGLVSSNGTLDKANNFKTAHEKLKEVYEVRDVDLTQKVPEDIKTLVIPGPTENFSGDELKKIDKFVMNGGSLIVLADGLKVKEGVLVEENKTNINELLEGYGLSLNHDIILDGQSNGQVSFTSGFMRFNTHYPGWVKIKEKNFNKDNAAVADLESALLPWPSSVEATGTEGVQKLIKSTEYAWSGDKNYDYRPSSDLKPTGGTGQYDLAVLANGKLKSPYEQGSTEKANVLLVGDSDFVSGQFLGQNKENLVLFQNMVDSVTLDSDLIKIRSKETTDRSIENVSASSKQIIKYLNIFGVTVVVVGFGLLRYYLRKRVAK